MSVDPGRSSTGIEVYVQPSPTTAATGARC
jgi:hypothetical protein